MKIFIFGPSCSGKSTLAEKLQENLGDDWSYLDRDHLIEQRLCDEITADLTLDEKNESLRNKLIIDAQIPWREKKEDELYLLLLPPLEVLLERDAERTRKLKRSEKRAYGAERYVRETYDALNKMDKKYSTALSIRPANLLKTK